MLESPGPRRPRRAGDLPVAAIAELAGVSPPTVSKVLNGRAGVGEETRRVFLFEQGRDLCLELLRRPDPPRRTRIELPTTLVVRDSTAPPR
jgi:DNA-binding LacI/PurR family transcriptional regulator